MSTIVKLDKVTRQPIAGTPQSGDLVRITTPSGAVIEHEYLEPAAPPPAIPSWDEFDFRKRFTSAERKAIKAASKNNADIEDFMSMLEAAGRTGTKIKAADPFLVAAMQMLEDLVLITNARKLEILGA